MAQTPKSSSPHVLTALICVAAVLSCLVAACSRTPAGEPLVAQGDRLFQEKSIHGFDLRGSRTVALTFDDGPTPRLTERLLDLLQAENVHATFFLLGEHVAGHEDILRRMRGSGHVIGNHSFSHPRLDSSPYVGDPQRAVEEIQRTHVLLKPFFAGQRHAYFRAPFGAWSPIHAAKLNANPELSPYIGPIYWNVGGELTFDHSGAVATAADWACWSSKTPVSVSNCADGYMHEIEKLGGGVVLMHDHSENTLQMVGELIHRLKGEGFGFATLDDVVALDGYE